MGQAGERASGRKQQNIPGAGKVPGLLNFGGLVRNYTHYFSGVLLLKLLHPPIFGITPSAQLKIQQSR